MAPLRINATVSDGRITVTFSHKASAANFDRYLRSLDNDFYSEQNCELAESGDQVSLKLPSGIATKPQTKPKDVNLIFDNAEDARVWGEKMILWEQTPPGTNKLKLSRDLSIEEFNSVMMDKPGMDLFFSDEGEQFIRRTDLVVTKRVKTSKKLMPPL